MVTALVIVLLSVSWLTTLWALERYSDVKRQLEATRQRPKHLPRKVADRARARHVPAPEPLERWATRPGPAVISAGREHRGLPPGFTQRFEDPPPPAFAPQPRSRPLGDLPLTTLVAQGWDDYERAHRPTTEQPVLVLSD